MSSDTNFTFEKLVQAVATYTDTSPLELPPLYDAIDPDTLNTCINQLTAVDVSFLYAGVTVRVDSSGSIQIDEKPLVPSLSGTEDMSIDIAD